MADRSDEIRGVIDSLRGRIRRYVVLEGIAVLAVLTVGWFWLTYLMDVGHFGVTSLELPSGVRTLAVIIGASALAAVGASWLATRVLRPLRTDALALLLERKFPEFRGSLMTALRPHGGHEPVGEAMLYRTRRDAADRLREVDVSDVLNPVPLRRWLIGGAAGLVSLLVLAGVNPHGLSRWADAYLFQKDGYWDRFRETELVVSLLMQPGDRVVPFVDGSVRHARGANLTVLADVPEGRTLPERVVLTVRGSSGSLYDQQISMTKSAAGRYRHTVLDVTEDLLLDFRAGDYATRTPYRVETVDAPRVDQIVLRNDYPDYTGLDQETSGILTVAAPSVALPVGTETVLQVRTNKPITGVAVRDESGRIDLSVETSGTGDSMLRVTDQGFELPLRLVSGEPAIAGNGEQQLELAGATQLKISLLDEDGLSSTRDAQLEIVAVPDRPPIVVARPSGVGTAITRKARVPFSGTLEDDYGLLEAWFDAEFREAEDDAAFLTPERYPLDVNVESRKQFALDPGQVALDLRPLSLRVGQSVRMAIAASDEDDLAGPNEGRSEALTLRIVSDDELLAVLYDKELNLRGRFERIIEEIGETRTTLADAADRLRAARDETAAEGQAGGAASAAAEQAVLAIRKNEGETRTVLDRFSDIRAELVNNRVDTDEALDRIDRGITVPLEVILDREFRETEESSVRTRTASRKQSGELATSIDGTVNRIDRLLDRLNAVLDEMQRRQSYNQLVKQLQQILEKQRALKERTEEKSVDDFFDDLIQ